MSAATTAALTARPVLAGKRVRSAKTVRCVPPAWKSPEINPRKRTAKSVRAPRPRSGSRRDLRALRSRNLLDRRFRVVGRDLPGNFARLDSPRELATPVAARADCAPAGKDILRQPLVSTKRRSEPPPASSRLRAREIPAADPRGKRNPPTHSSTGVPPASPR